MKKIVLIMAMTALLSATALGEMTGGKVSGQLKGKVSREPVEYASVVLYKNGTQELVTGMLTDSVGNFCFENISAGDYYLLCNYVGYEKLQSPVFTVTNGKDVKVGVLWMDDSGVMLGEVDVVGQKSTYVQTIDKKIFNVGTDIASSSGAVSDLLQNIPSVQVDVEGNVSLRGNENVLILIDGKPSVLTRGANRATVLQQLPAGSIERVEVITNPSAQFKPDGTSGIINIVTKKNQRKGFNGSVTANIGNGIRWNSGFTLGYTSPKFSINANYNFRHDRRDRWTDVDRTLTDSASGEQTFVKQRSVRLTPSNAHTMGLGIQWNITGNDCLEASGSFTYMTFPRTEDNRTWQSNNTAAEKEFNRHRDAHEIHLSAEGAAAYTHNFGKERTLTIDYTYAMQDELEDNHFTEIYTLPVLPDKLDNTLIKNKNYENLIRAIYEGKISKNSKIVAGYEAELDKSDSRYYAEDFMDVVWVKNVGKSNNFVFNEQVHSLYFTWEQKFGAFAFLAGVRGEQSFITSNLLALNQKIKDNYFMFYPTLHTSYKINESNELQLNYSLRVNRPESEDLNPFPEYQDPYNIRSGNPHLRPEKIHSVEFGWQYSHKSTTVTLTPYYRYTFNKMTMITRVLSNGVIETTLANMSSSSAAGAEAVLNTSIGRWCNLNLSSNIFYNTIDASELGYAGKKSAVSWYASLNANFMPIRNLILQLNTRYQSSTLTPQGKIGQAYILNLGAKYEIKKIHLSFTATVSDLFNSYKRVIDIATPTFTQHQVIRRAPRTFYFGVIYAFGKHGTKKQAQDLKYDENL